MKRRHLVAAVTGAVMAVVSSAAIVAITLQPSRPDPHLTPGAVLTTSAAIVCVSGYTATVRVSLTPAEQRQVDAAYHWTFAPGKQEYDHLIPLELGGANGLKNIWPQPIAQARVKDGLENRLHALACSHQITLQNAQSCIRADWVACARMHP